MSSETLWSQYAKIYPPSTVNGIMTELSFAKSFLSTLDSRPLKLQPDHVSNPKTLEITNSYTLPRMPNAFKKPVKGEVKVDTEAQKLSELNVTLKSSRNPVLSLSLPGTDVGASVLSLKEKVAKDVGYEGTEKIRVLYKKKPVGDVKTIKEIVGDEDIGREVEFAVMVMGYKEVDSKSEDTPMQDVEAPVEQGLSGDEVLGAEDFWNDLRSFLLQRIGDERKAGEVFDAFRGSWTGNGGI